MGRGLIHLPDEIPASSSRFLPLTSSFDSHISRRSFFLCSPHHCFSGPRPSSRCRSICPDSFGTRIRLLILPLLPLLLRRRETPSRSTASYRPANWTSSLFRLAFPISRSSIPTVRTVFSPRDSAQTTGEPTGTRPCLSSSRIFVSIVTCPLPPLDRVTRTGTSAMRTAQRFGKRNRSIKRYVPLQWLILIFKARRPAGAGKARQAHPTRPI